MITLDYKCECGKTKLDKLVKHRDSVVTCECGKQMKKMICAPRLGGMDKNGSSTNIKIDIGQ